MKRMQESGSWNPYLAGALAGIVIVVSVWVSGKYVGASTTFVRSAGLIEKMVNPEHVKQLDYFQKEAPKIDWQWMFVVGIFLGSLASALTSGTFKLQALPDMWQSRFGSSIGRRAGAAFLGGLIALFGARLADG